MLIRQAFRFRLREQPAQARDYARTAGCCRFVWNKALALQQRYFRLFGVLDDEQDDDDIKVFIGVKLLGHCSWGDNEQAPRELADLLDELAVSVCCDSNGKQLVHPDDWELFDVEDAE